MALSYAQKQMAKRRSGDINRLTSDYQRAVEQYKQNVGTKEEAFKGEMEKYNQSYGAYSEKATAYQTRLLDYMNKLKTYRETPETTVHSEIRWKYGTPSSGIFYRVSDLGKANSKPPEYRLNPGEEFINLNAAAPDYGKVVTRGGLTRPADFTEKFEEVAPEAPASMDISAEKTALQGEKDYTDREIAERSKARLRAVGRGTQRTMLSSGTNLTVKA
jgi:hypothetical protein